MVQIRKYTWYHNKEYSYIVILFRGYNYYSTADESMSRKQKNTNRNNKEMYIYSKYVS